MVHNVRTFFRFGWSQTPQLKLPIFFLFYLFFVVISILLNVLRRLAEVCWQHKIEARSIAPYFKRAERVLRKQDNVPASQTFYFFLRCSDRLTMRFLNLLKSHCHILTQLPQNVVLFHEFVHSRNQLSMVENEKYISLVK